MKSVMGTATVLSGLSPRGSPPWRSMVPITVSSIRPSLIFCPSGSAPGKSESTTVEPITATRAASSASASVYPRPLATGRLLMVKNSGVPPATCVPRLVYEPAYAVLAYSHISAPTCFACGSASRSALNCETVIFLRAATSGEKLPNCTAGQRWIWKESAPSAPSCLLMDLERPLSSAIIATTVKTPMTIPRSVSPERSLCPLSAPSASRRSSTRARSGTVNRSSAGIRTLESGAWTTDSLIAQRLDGLEQRRGQRGPQAESGPQHRRAKHAADHHPRIDARRQWRDHVHQRSRARAQRDAEDAADDGHHDGLAEELHEDGAAPRPQRPADADLPRPLLHRDEQDVHDADARHDGGDDAHQDAGDVGGHHHRVEAFQQLVLAVDGEVLVLIGRQVARVAHHRSDLVLGLAHLAVGRHHRDHQASLGAKGAHERGERDDHAQVLRRPEGVPLAGEDAHDGAAHGGAGADHLAQRIHALEEGVLDVGADDADAGAQLLVQPGDEAALADLPAGGVEIAVDGAAHVHALHVARAVGDGGVGADHGRDGHRQRGVLLQRAQVEHADLWPVLVFPPVVAAHAPLPLVHEERVGPERAQLAGEARGHAGFHHEDEDHRHDADGDGGDGQRGAQLVRDQRERGLDDGIPQLGDQPARLGCPTHGGADASSGSAGGFRESRLRRPRRLAHGRAPWAAFSAAMNCASASAPSASALASATSRPGPSAMTRPSTMRTARGQRAASLGSWVTRMMVLPFLRSSRKRPTISSPVRLSRLPVGSSASSKEGCVTSARAMATRCFWPPESSAGLCFMRSSRPTSLSASTARSRRSFLLTPR